jgi:hypothetical protein
LVESFLPFSKSGKNFFSFPKELYMSLKTKWTSGILFVFLFLTSFWFGWGCLAMVSTSIFLHLAAHVKEGKIDGKP